MILRQRYEWELKLSGYYYAEMTPQGEGVTRGPSLFTATDQALAHGRKKDTITMTREKDSGSKRRRMRGRERGDGNREVRSLEPRSAAAGMFCPSAFG